MRGLTTFSSATEKKNKELLQCKSFFSGVRSIIDFSSFLFVVLVVCWTVTSGPNLDGLVMTHEYRVQMFSINLLFPPALLRSRKDNDTGGKPNFSPGC